MTESLYNLSYTLANKRTRFSWRAAIVASSGQALEDMFSKGQTASRAVDEPGLGFVFTGQGAQWARMGAELMRYLPYRQSLQCADVYLKTLGCEWSVIGESILIFKISIYREHALVFALANTSCDRRTFKESE